MPKGKLKSPFGGYKKRSTITNYLRLLKLDPIIQSGISSSANYIVKKSTGKSITEHAIQTIDSQTLKTSYFPEIKKVQKIDKLKHRNLKK